MNMIGQFSSYFDYVPLLETKKRLVSLYLRKNTDSIMVGDKWSRQVTILICKVFL